MTRVPAIACLIAMAALATSQAAAYPGGTPDFQTDVTPFCAACHASLEKEHLEGAGIERSEREVATTKHHAAVLAGQRHYQILKPEERAQLVKWLAAVDAAKSMGPDELETLGHMTHDRAETMDRIRNAYFQSEQQLSQADRNFVLDVTILFENAVLSLGRIRHLLTPSDDVVNPS